MMAITGASIQGAGDTMQAGGIGANRQMDSVSKNIQNQIAAAQQELQQLSSNNSMSPEEKMKKRQEIGQKIATLNQQLRQHQIEQRKEAQAQISSGEVMPDRRDTKQPGNGLSQTSMQAMISADSSVKQAETLGSVSSKLEGRANVLQAEIKQDAGRGANTAQKSEEVSALLQRAQTTQAAQLTSLAQTMQEGEHTAKAEQDKEEDRKADKPENGDVFRMEDGDGLQILEEDPEQTAQYLRSVTYRPVDVRL